MKHDSHFLFNNPNLKPVRKKLRINQTPHEAKLWRYLRNKALLGFKFFRQFGIGPYIVDFYCPEKHLVIELDGGHHLDSEVMKSDIERDAYMRFQKINVVRFFNTDVDNDIDAILELIAEKLS